MTRRETLIRLAALIDGEGTISIQTHKRIRGSNGTLYPCKMAVISLANTDPSMPVEFVEAFGCGHVTSKRRAANQKILYRWTVVGKQASEIVGQLQPHLGQKRLHADLVLRFQTMQAVRSRDPERQRQRHEVRDRMVAEIRELNRRGA